MSSEDDESVEPIAALVHRLAVMVEAGIAPASAWQHCATAKAPAIVHGVAARSSRGEAIPQAILAETPVAEAALAWRAIAAAWLVSTQAGAPIAGTLTALADALRDLEQLRRETAAVLAGPASTARLVMVLPAVGLLFGLALGFDTLGVLVGSPVGWGCLAVGALLLYMGTRWNRRLLSVARATQPAPGLRLDLLAVAVTGGGAIEHCARSVADALEHCGLSDTGRERGEEVLALARRAGVPAAALLRAEAVQERRNARSDGAERAARLAVRLMLPLGLCILPAFIVLGVVPLMVAVVSGTVAP